MVRTVVFATAENWTCLWTWISVCLQTKMYKMKIYFRLTMYEILPALSLLLSLFIIFIICYIVSIYVNSGVRIQIYAANDGVCDDCCYWWFSTTDIACRFYINDYNCVYSYVVLLWQRNLAYSLVIFHFVLYDFYVIHCFCACDIFIATKCLVK